MTCEQEKQALDSVALQEEQANQWLQTCETQLQNTVYANEAALLALGLTIASPLESIVPLASTSAAAMALATAKKSALQAEERMRQLEQQRQAAQRAFEQCLQESREVA